MTPPDSIIPDAELANLRRQWSFEPGVTYLNHGSFGPAPRPVREARQAWFERLERDPMDFFVRQLQPALLDVRARIAKLIGAQVDDVVLVDNATYGVNVVAASLRLSAGDEVLLTDHEYGAVERIWRRACERVGANVVVQPLPRPLVDADETARSFVAGVTPRTCLAMVSHITSPTAVILPIERIGRALAELGVPLLVDGPHAPGIVDIDVRAIGCDYYAASCHKWLSAPFGSGFLYVHPRSQAAIDPPVLSWGREYPPNQPGHWTDEFTWLGTRDPAAMLSVSPALDFLAKVGIERFRAHAHALARYARSLLEEVTGTQALVPDDSAWYGAMIAAPLPAGDHETLLERLWCNHRIEIAVTRWGDERLVRPSCHLYTVPSDLDRLADALRQELRN